MRGNVLVRCGEGSEETDVVKAHGAFVLLHLHSGFRQRLQPSVRPQLSEDPPTPASIFYAIITVSREGVN